MISKKAAIIIVNWNGKRFLKNCLTAVFKQTYKSFDVFFVDNGSIDESSRFVKQKFPKVRIIQLDKNYGFAKANNEGIKETFKDKAVEYIVCLNNDTIVDKNWLKELIKTSETNINVGMVSSKAYFMDGKTINNAGLIYSPILQLNKDGGISLGYGKTDKEMPELNKDCEIFVPGGVASLYKRNILEIIYAKDKEIFDEDYFAYAEDLDLGIRIRKLKYISFLSAKAKLIHLHSQTMGKASLSKIYYCERNTIFTIIKNSSFIDIVLFPLRNLLLKTSYLLKRNDSAEKLKNTHFFGLLLIVLKANIIALIMAPKFFIKRIRNLL